jgi:hypothetical protein
MDDEVNALTVWEGALIAGGLFTTAGGIPAARLAAWLGSWSSAGPGVEGSFVAALAVFGGNLYVGGEFVAVGGVPADNLAAYDGFGWSEPGGGTDGFVLALRPYQSGLIVGGGFTMAGGMPFAQVARWNGLWSAIGAGIAGGGVLGFGEWQTHLIVGGFFESLDGIPADNVATWDGVNAGPLGSGTDNAVYAVHGFEKNLWAGGAFFIAGGKRSSHIAVREPDPNDAVPGFAPVKGLALAPARPNPAYRTVHMDFVLPKPGRVQFDIIDVSGRRVRRLIDSDLPAASHSIRWDGHDSSNRAAPTGLYFGRLRFAGAQLVQKVVIAR